jgi:hypothetical protein
MVAVVTVGAPIIYTLVVAHLTPKVLTAQIGRMGVVRDFGSAILFVTTLHRQSVHSEIKFCLHIDCAVVPHYYSPSISGAREFINLLRPGEDDLACAHFARGSDVDTSLSPKWSASQVPCFYEIAVGQNAETDIRPNIRGSLEAQSTLDYKHLQSYLHKLVAKKRSTTKWEVTSLGKPASPSKTRCSWLHIHQVASRC